MKKKDRKALGWYIRHIADEMGLRDWRFELEFGDPDFAGDSGSFCIATCQPVIGRKIANIKISPQIRFMPKDDICQTVCHELLHCHFFGMWDTIRRDTLPRLSQDAYDLLTSSVERHMEYGIDAASDAVAKAMPLIDWKNCGDE